MPKRSPKAPGVDLELLLAVEVSSSIDGNEKDIQRTRYVATFSDPRLGRATRAGQFRRITVAYVERADSIHQLVALPWRLIDGEACARSHAKELQALPTTHGTDCD